MWYTMSNSQLAINVVHYVKLTAGNKCGTLCQPHSWQLMWYTMSNSQLAINVVHYVKLTAGN